jgi:hypothetical protein
MTNKKHKINKKSIKKFFDRHQGKIFIGLLIILYFLNKFMKQG